MPEVLMSGFKSVAFDFGQIHMRGGLLNKALPMQSKTVREHAGSAERTFVKISCNETWLCKAVSGDSRWRNVGCARQSLIERLKDLVLKAANGELESASSDHLSDAIPDPMDGIVESPSRVDEEHRVCGWKRRRYRGAQKQIFKVRMQERPEEEVGEDHQEQRVISLYVDDRVTIWLALEDVEWAVRYLYVQHVLKGVPLVSEDSTGPCGNPDACSRSRGDAHEMTGK